MSCPVCRNGDLSPGFTSLTFERGEATIVVKGVPADICSNCGEAFVAEPTARRVSEVAEQEARRGVTVEVVHFAA